ncbi:uncharacterized protein METZ01_LOCUS313998, partial [marine metagenome]
MLASVPILVLGVTNPDSIMARHSSEDPT